MPAFAGTESILLATGILGATVMPHVIYLHSALTQNRIQPWNDGERRELLRFERLDVGARHGHRRAREHLHAGRGGRALPRRDRRGLDRGSPRRLQAQLGGGAAVAFGIALLASGLSSSSVGTYAGQVVMQGFIRRSIPLLLRRLVTMAPALVVLAIGLDPTKSLVASQVVLSFGIPFALVPLVLLTRRRDIMGDFVNALAHHGDRERGGRPDHRPQPVPAGKTFAG